MAGSSSQPPLLAASSASDPTTANSRRKWCTPLATVRELRHATTCGKQSPSSTYSSRHSCAAAPPAAAAELTAKSCPGIVGGQPHDAPRLAAAQHADTPELPHPRGIHASPVLSSPPWHHVLSSRWTPHRRPLCVRCNANKNRDSHAVSTVKQHATGPIYRRCNNTKPLTCCHCSLPPPPSSCFLPHNVMKHQ